MTPGQGPTDAQAVPVTRGRTDRCQAEVSTVKRLAIYLDGTWNSPRSRTNVTLLNELTADADGQGNPQLLHYDDGVGNALGQWLTGGLFGSGLSEKVVAAYDWLAQTYEDGDAIYLFGFSRGAFTARSLAGMIARHGLTRPSAQPRGQEVFALYRRTGYATLAPDARHIPIEFIGVWDTGGALGVPFGRMAGVSRSSFRFHDTYPSTHYLNAYQALAIDEGRPAFVPTLWTRFHRFGPPFPPWERELEQRWFVGAHTDVGGGGPGSPLAKIPAKWMQDRAKDSGLVFHTDITLTGNEKLAPIQDSFSTFLFGLYRLLHGGKRAVRTIGRPPEPAVAHGQDGFSVTVNETIDRSVFERWQSDPHYRPPGLLDWAGRSGIDPTTMTNDVPA
jgi:uncharacterized protein (DUF2235 family)